MTSPLRFSSKVYDSAQGVALREFNSRELSPAMSVAKRLQNSGRWRFGASLASAPLILAGTVFIGAGFLEAAAATALGIAALSTPALVELPSSIRRNRFQAKAVSAEKELESELHSWLATNYGLRVEHIYWGRESLGKKMLSGQDYYRSIPLMLSTESNVELRGQLVSLGDGEFELRKQEIRDTSESVYFATVNEIADADSSFDQISPPAQPVLSAHREPSSSLTIERETSS